MTAESLVQITIRQTTTQRETVQYPDFKDGIRCGIRARYSVYDDRWRIWLLALDGTTITGPIKLVPGIDLLAGTKHDPRVPQGQLFVYAVDREPPTATTIDRQAVLYYRRAS